MTYGAAKAQTVRSPYDRARSTKLTGTVATLFKEVFGLFIGFISIIVGIGFAGSVFGILSNPKYSSGTFEPLLMAVLGLFLVGSVFVAIFGMVAIQIRNNDYLLDIHEEQRKTNALLAEFVDIAKEA